MPSESGDAAAPGPSSEKLETPTDEATTKSKDYVEELASSSTTNIQQPAGGQDGRPRRPTRGQEPFSQAERDEMEKLLEELRGHLGEPDHQLSTDFVLTLVYSTLPYPFP